MSTERQSGRTTRQILDAPTNAVYVWCNSRIYYAVKLAEHLRRDDIYFVPPSWLNANSARAFDLPLVIDHACELNVDQLQALRYIRDRQDVKRSL